MTTSELLARRLHSQQLVAQKMKKPADVVAWLGAVQSQDYMGGKWSVGMRTAGGTDAAVERAIESRTIVRTWVHRGTLHFVTPADIRWMLAVFSERTIARSAARYRQLELDEGTLAKSNVLLLKAVQGGKGQTRRELLAMLKRSDIATDGQRAPHLLARAALDGLIVQTVTRKNDPTYLALEEAVPKAKSLSRQDALAELAKRYFQSHGPATVQDFAWWTGLTLAESNLGLEAVRGKLVSDGAGKQAYWMTPATAAVHSTASATYLLQAYDECGSYKERLAFISAEHLQQIFLTNGLTGTVLANGRVIGTWKRKFSKGEAIITPALFAQPSATARRAIAQATNRYGAFLGVPAVLSPDSYKTLKTNE